MIGRLFQAQFDRRIAVELAGLAVGPVRAYASPVTSRAAGSAEVGGMDAGCVRLVFTLEESGSMRLSMVCVLLSSGSGHDGLAMSFSVMPTKGCGSSTTCRSRSSRRGTASCRPPAGPSISGPRPSGSTTAAPGRSSRPTG